MRIEKDLNLSGLFWLPSDPSVKLSGNLLIKNGGRISLELHGGFQDSEEIGTVFGQVEELDSVTLQGCRTGGSGFNSGIVTSLVSAHSLLSGGHFERSFSLKVNNFKFEFDGLNEWIDRSGIKFSRDKNSDEINVLFKPLEELSYQLSSLNIEMLIKSKSSYSYPVGQVKNFSITQTFYIELRSIGGENISTFVNLAHKLINFFVYLTGKTLTIYEVFVERDDIVMKIGDKEYPKQMSFVYKAMPFEAIEPEISYNDFLIKFEFVQDRLEQVLNKWLEAFDQLAPPLNLYISVKNNSYDYLNDEFMALVHALESLHRRTSTRTKIDVTTYRTKVANIAKSHDKKERAWLIGRLKYGYELSLSQRLTFLVKEFKEFFGNKKERKKMVRSIVDTRNYLTHFDSRLADKSLHDAALWNTIMKMDALLQLHFLDILGFNSDDILNSIKSCYRFQMNLEGTAYDSPIK